MRWKCCLFFWCVFFADSVAAQAVCPQASRRLLSTDIPIRIYDTNHIKLIPKAGDKNFSISSPMAFSRGENLYIVDFAHDDVPAKLSLFIATNSQGHQDIDVLEKMEFILKNLPSIALKEVKVIRVHSPSVVSLNNKSNLATFTSLLKTIDIFAPKLLHNLSLRDMLDLFQHEIGHAMALAYYGSIFPDEHWVKAIEVDNTMVSSYGQTDTKEDFAEAMMVYLATEGGTQDILHQRGTFFHRFKILDEILKVDTNLLPIPNLTSAQKLMVVASFHPKVASGLLNITVPSVRGKSFSNLLKNDEGLKVAEYKKDIMEVSRSFGVEEEEMLEVLKMDYLLGMVRAEDAFDSQNIEEILALMDRLKKTITSHNFATIFHYVLRFKADLKILGKVMERMPQEIDTNIFLSMFESALKYQADSQILDKVMEHMPRDIDGENFSRIFKIAVRNKADPQTLGKVMERMPRDIGNNIEAFMGILYFALKYQADPEILKRLEELL